MILYELCLLKNPLGHINNLQQLVNDIVNEDLTKLDKKCEENYSVETCNLIKKILVKNPDERPTIDQIIEKCKEILLYIKNSKTYYNNVSYIFLCDKEYSEPEFTNQLKGIFGGEIPDGKYIIKKNNENKDKTFHIIDGRKVFDYTKKIQNLRRYSVDNFIKKSNNKEIQKQNNINLFFPVIDDPYDKDIADNELKSTINRITRESFYIFNKGEKSKEPFKNFNFPNTKRYNGYHEQQNRKISKGLKSDQKTINNNFQRNRKNFKSKEHFSNKITALYSNTGKTQNDSEEEEIYNNSHLLTMNNYENDETGFNN